LKIRRLSKNLDDYLGIYLQKKEAFTAFFKISKLKKSCNGNLFLRRLSKTLGTAFLIIKILK
jgi:hypothetical protein